MIETKNNCQCKKSSNEVQVKIKKFDKNKKMYIPEYATEGSSGMDIKSIEDVMILSNSRKLIQTNISVQLPPNFEIQIRPRSGLALKKGITVLNSPGTIDEGYLGPIGIILINTSNEFFYVKDGDRIAQMVLQYAPKMKLIETEQFIETERGTGGFGSTGT